MKLFQGLVAIIITIIVALFLAECEKKLLAFHDDAEILSRNDIKEIAKRMRGECALA